MNDPFRDPFAIEAGELLDEVHILKQYRSLGAGDLRVLIVPDRRAGAPRQGKSLSCHRICQLGAIRAGLAEQSSLEAKLRFACEAWGAEGFELVLANPDAKDMFDLSFAPVRQGYAAFEELLVELLEKLLSRAKLDVQADELARVIVFGIKGFKDIARDGAEMRRLIGAQVAVVVAALDAR